MLAQSQIDVGVDRICPLRGDVSWQAIDAQALDITPFHMDGEAQQGTCPQGHLSAPWIAAKGTRGRPTIEVQFHKEAWRAWPERTCSGQVQTDTFLRHQVKFFVFIGAEIPQI